MGLKKNTLSFKGSEGPKSQTRYVSMARRFESKTWPS